MNSEVSRIDVNLSKELEEMKIRAHTQRNAETYAEEFGVSEQELWTFLSDKVVMDLGSGVGRFGADVALASLDTNWKPPQRLDLVDLRYADPNYEAFWAKQLSGLENVGLIFTLSLPTIDGHKKLSFRYDDPVVQMALQKSKSWRKAASWNNLSQFPIDYDLILSDRGYPYYSTLSDPVYKEGLVIDEQTQNAFEQIIKRLKPGGRFIAVTNFYLKDFEADPTYKADLASFLGYRNCLLSMKANTDDEAVMFLTKVA